MTAAIETLERPSRFSEAAALPDPGRPLRVLIVAGSYPPDVRGGGEISTRILAESLAALGCPVDVLTCARSERHEEGSGVRIHRIASPNVYWNGATGAGPARKLAWHLLENWNPRARRAVAREIARVRPDIVVTSTVENFGAEAWIAARAAGVPCVHFLRSYYAFCWRASAFRRGRNCQGDCGDCRLLSHGRRRASGTVSGVIGISRFILEQHRALGLFPAAQCTAISNPVGIAPAPGPKAKASPVRFGYLGIISPNKGLELLHGAWSASAGAGAELTIAGSGSAAYEGDIRRLFGDSASFAGWVESRRFLEGIDFLIVPSVWNEPFGRIVVEAFAAGVPVIGSRTGGIPEIVDAGRNGYLFAGSDAADLTRVIREAAAIDAEAYAAMSASALASAAGYQAGEIARRYLAFLNSVSSQGDAPHASRR